MVTNLDTNTGDNLVDELIPESGYVILVVDDEVENLDLLTSTLRKGNKILRASSGEEALEYINKQELHMLITDQRMPGISGVELLSHIKNIQPEVIRILITGYTDSKVAVDAINEGEVHRYVHKPWNPKELQTIVRMELERHSLREKAKRLTQDLMVKNEELRQVNQEVLSQKKNLEELAEEYRRQKEIALEMSKKLALANRELIQAQEEIKLKNNKMKSVNKKLERLSVTDGLTGFYNHRQMKFLLSSEIGRARRYSLRLSVMMIDLDHFKDINDTYGHLAGDQVIRKVTEIIRKNIRDTDMPTRYGGDEFLLILPHTGEDKAIYLAKRIHREVLACNFKSPQGNFKQTVSVGIAFYPHPKAKTLDEFIHHVDQALYVAKEKGRNRVVIYK